MILVDADATRPRFLGLGCRIEGNRVVCQAVAIDEDISSTAISARLISANQDTAVELLAQPVPRTNQLFDRFVEEMHFEIKTVSR